MSLVSTAKVVSVFMVLGVPAGVFGIVRTLATGDVRWMYHAGKRIANMGLRAAGITFDVQGHENIPTDRPCIYMANHVSNLDPPTLIPLLPGTPSVMVKKSLMRIPLLGPAMRMGRFVAVERDGDRRSATQAIKAAAEALQSGLSLLIFVEGTRSRTGRLQIFKRGPFHLAQSMGATIVPVAIWGTERMMQKGSAAITPGIAHIRFLPAISPANHTNRDNLMQEVRASMLRALPEHMHPLPPTRNPQPIP